ncbi:MAG: GNAT family N-acetyltransferase [Psychromonas sp.]|nr:GNAT family N-acetyltransferase [Alteromonadales bacterium]MCP5079793.1 GNAT family N-acetyltransferase [Psychromonas sp.]
MTDSSCRFIELERVKIPLVNQFYKRVYKKGIAGKNEAVFIIKDNLQIICSARLKTIEAELLLTGVACDPLFQSQGYASSLIRQLLAKRDQSVYCFPYAHLKAFYLRLGFVLISTEEVPEAIHNRFERYQQHRDLLLMIYKQ